MAVRDAGHAACRQGHRMTHAVECRTVDPVDLLDHPCRRIKGVSIPS